MDTARVTREGDHQIVSLPRGVSLPTGTVSVRQEGEAVILEPVRAAAWPEGFFEEIHISDPAFERPAQGQLPSIKGL